jgi:hypothetical protein
MTCRLRVDAVLPTTRDLEAFLTLIAWFDRNYPGCKIRVLAGRGDLSAEDAKEILERCGLNHSYRKQ